MSDTRRVVLYGSFAEDQAFRLAPILPSGWEMVPIARASEPAARAAAFADADALVTVRFDRDLPAAAGLALIQLPAAGYDGIDLAAIPPGCRLCNTYEHEDSIAEYVLLAMLEWCIGLRRLDARLRRGQWHGGGPARLLRHETLMGKTLGIVGAGHIARAAARRAWAMGMEVAAVSRTPRAEDPDLGGIAGMDGLPALLGRADFLLLTCPLSEATRDLIAAEQLAAMKPGAVLINVARGEVVAEEPLYRALAEGRIGGAVLDVWYQYPKDLRTPTWPSRFPFHELDNVILSPHASGWTENTLDRRWQKIAENLDNLAAGRPLLNEIDLGR